MSQKAGQHLAVNNGACWIRQTGIQKPFLRSHPCLYRSGHMLTQNITVISVVTHSHKNIMVVVTVHSTRMDMFIPFPE